MNHHLRFPRQSALAATSAIFALALSSCSTTKVPPLAAMPEKEITYEVQIFDVPADHPFGDQKTEILSAEEGATLMKSLKKAPTFFATTGGRIAEKKTLSNKKEFIYPTDYSPIKYAKPGSGSFPVTPATPINFETTKTGTTVSVTGLSTSTGENHIDILIDRKILLGFTNYGKPITTDATDFFGRKVPVVITENRIEKPNFRKDQIKTVAMLPEGNYLAIRNIGATSVTPGKFPFTAKRPAGFIALVRATTR